LNYSIHSFFQVDLAKANPPPSEQSWNQLQPTMPPINHEVTPSILTVKGNNRPLNSPQLPPQAMRHSSPLLPLSALFWLLLIMFSGSVALSSPYSEAGSNPQRSKRVKTKHFYSEIHASLSPRSNDTDSSQQSSSAAGRLEELKQREAELAKLLAAVRQEKLSAIRSRPLTIGVVGFGRFGQFIARTFQKYGRVVVTSRTDYTDIASGMGVTYVPLSNIDGFLAQELDVIVVATSILSFESTIRSIVPHLEKYIMERAEKGGAVKGPLIVDVLSVKEHARQVMLDLLPPECDILCTHPMFGPDSGKKGWHALNFVYEKTRIDKLVLETVTEADTEETLVDTSGVIHSIHEDSEARIEAIDRVERFLSIWEEEGCRMVPSK
jgi:arogenate dehydrogenase (NADP+), plant